jgi:hypothetical protein
MSSSASVSNAATGSSPQVFRRKPKQDESKSSISSVSNCFKMLQNDLFTPVHLGDASYRWNWVVTARPVARPSVMPAKTFAPKTKSPLSKHIAMQVRYRCACVAPRVAGGVLEMATEELEPCRLA